MYDRPTLSELIDAARLHLETNIIPAVRAEPKLYFQTLVAANVLRIATREITLGYEHALTEWTGLNHLRGTTESPPARLDELQRQLVERNRSLCTAIRSGECDADEQRQQAFEHIKGTTIAQLQVANPRLLQTYAQEDGV